MNHSGKSIFIFGPTETESYFGGVAVFSDGLLLALRKKGYDAHHVFYPAGGAILLSGFLKILGALVQISRACESTVVILQLQYGVLAPVLWLIAKWRRVKIIYVAHGFPPASYGFFRRLALRCVYSVARMFSDIFVANSSYTSSILSAVFGYKIDCVINPSVSDRFICSMMAARAVALRRPKSVLFVGRLAIEKKVDTIIRAFKAIHDVNASFRIVGDGPEAENLKRIAEDDQRISFLGRQSQEEVANLLLESSLFVSANDHEPYGIVYAEALMAGCLVLCPSSGGQLDMLSLADGRLRLGNFCSASELSSLVRQALTIAPPQSGSAASLVDDFSYEKCAEKFEDLFL